MYPENSFCIFVAELVIFSFGFIMLSLLFQLPYVGWLIRLLALRLGVGTIFYCAQKNWPRLTAPTADSAVL